MAPIRTDPGFVGRTRELTRLEQVLDQVVLGASAAVLVAGDAGVGKTRLTGELVRRAEARGVVGVVGHCVDLGSGGLPYLPFAEALTEVVRAGDGGRAPAGAAAAVRAVAQRRPVLRRLTGRVDRQVDGILGAEDALELMPLYEAVLDALHAVTTEVAPVLLVLEDLHWADASTRDLLRFVLSRLSADRLLVVGTYRTDDLHRRHPLRPLLAELVRLPRVERLDVAPFDSEELRAYLRLLHGSAVREAVVEDIRARSEGNAYYAEELLAAADDATADPAWLAPTLPGPPNQTGRRRRTALPEGLAEVLLARLERLTPVVQQVARVASVAGRRVPDALLRAAAGLEPHEADDALREAVAHHVLVPDGADRYAFRHALLQEAVYGDLLPGERVRLHATFARLLAEQGDNADAADLARHCLAAHDTAGALAASVRAAERAAAGLAPAEALAHYEQALQLWPAVPAGARPDGVDAVTLTSRAAAAASSAGERLRGLALAREAVALATSRLADASDPTVEAAARGRLAHHLYDAELQSQALTEIAIVRRLLEGRGPSPVRVWAAAVEARVAASRGDLDLTRRLVEPALEEARGLGLAGAEADLLISLAVREGADGVVDDAAHRLALARRRALDADDPLVALRAVYNLAINRIDVGDLSGARHILEDGLADAEHAGLALTMYGVESQQMLLHALVLAGEWDLALDTQARTQARSPSTQQDLLTAPVLRVLAARDPLTALTATADLLPMAEAMPWSSHTVLAPRADAQRWVGDHDGAVATVQLCRRLKAEDGEPHDLGQLVVLGVGLGALADAAEGAAARGDDERVGRLRDEGDEMLGHALEVAGRGTPRLGVLGPEGRAWLLRSRAEAGRLHGRSDPATWEEAVEAFGFGQVYEVARSRRHLAEALAAGGDRAQASRHARLARSTADDLGARPLREALDALARRARLDLGSGPVASSVLTPREQDVMRLVAQGLTNRQIGRRLLISEKTASVHVSNILAKLGAGGRTEAVAIVHRRGLLPDEPSAGGPAGA